jgi:Ca2+-binding RTX toxin-like protein
MVQLTAGDDRYNQDTEAGDAIAQADTINALAGDDFIETSTLGGSLVLGGIGRDTLLGNGPADTLAGGANEDVLRLTGNGNFGFGDNIPNPAQLQDIDNANFGPAGNDSIEANGRSSVYGGSGDDFVQGISGSNWFSGNQGNDTLIAGLQGRDSIYGGKGADVIGALLTSGGSNNLGIQGLQTSGSQLQLGGPSGNFISGNSGTDLVRGSQDRDMIYGGKDNDTLEGMGSQVYVSGDLGNDIVSVMNRGAEVAFSEKQAIQASERSTLLGGSGNDSLQGPIGNFGDGRNSLDGGVGNDTIRGWASRDTLLGGTGDDLISTGLPDDSLNGLVNQNGVPLNSPNYLGQNLLDGGEGNDTLRAGSVSDSMIGGLGNDCLTGIFNQADGGVGNDTIDATSIGTGVAISQITLVGGVGNDVLIGNTNAGVTNYFNGGTGNDRITFGGRSDELIGDDRGNDLVDASEVGFGSITDFSSGVEGVSIGDSQGNNTLLGSLGDDSLVAGGGNDSLRGEGGRDTLFAGGGNDILWGGSGSDSLNGGDGNDTLYGQGSSGSIADVLIGGQGQDRFGFFGETNAQAITTIRDFNPTDDAILLGGNSYLDGNGNPISSTNFQFIAVPSGANYRPDVDPRGSLPAIIYERNPVGADGTVSGVGSLKYDFNGALGDGSDVITIARFLPDSSGATPNLTANDIIII